MTGREPLLSVQVVSCGPPTVIEISGEIDLYTAHLVTELVEHVARHRHAQVILDMVNVSFFCADGLRALIHARATLTAANGQLLLRAPSPQTRHVLTITGTEHLFPLDAMTSWPTAGMPSQTAMTAAAAAGPATRAANPSSG
jgi:anti-sigma B factor antagonist